MSQNVHYIAGVERYKAGNYTIAIECFLLAIESEPGVADHHEQAGISFFHSGDKENALFHYNKAQQLDPRNPFRYASRAYIRDSMGDTEGAIADYRIAIELDPEDAVAHNNLGLLEEKLGYKQASEMRFKRADELAEEYGFGPSAEFREAHDKSTSNGQSEQPAVDATPAAPEQKNGSEAKADPAADAPKVTPPAPSSLWSVIGNVFSSKSSRQEFWAFVRNGFRMK